MLRITDLLAPPLLSSEITQQIYAMVTLFWPSEDHIAPKDGIQAISPDMQANVL